MTSHATVVLQDLTLRFSVNESQNNHSKWPEMALYLALLLSIIADYVNYHTSLCVTLPRPRKKMKKSYSAALSTTREIKQEKNNYITSYIAT